MAWRIGADIGGTFIDFCALDTRSNRLESLKVLTTPDEPGRELMDGSPCSRTARRRSRRDRGFRPRHHGRHQHHHPAQGRTPRARHDGRLRGCDRARAPAHAGDVFALLREGRAADLTRPRLRRPGAHARRWQRGRASRSRTRSPRRSPRIRAKGAKASSSPSCMPIATTPMRRRAKSIVETLRARALRLHLERGLARHPRI